MLRLSDDDQIRGVWAATRTQILELEARTNGLEATVTDPVLADHLQRLGHSVASLRGALDSSVSLRLDPDVDPAAKATLVESATQTVLDRRRELDAALRPLVGVGRETT